MASNLRLDIRAFRKDLVALTTVGDDGIARDPVVGYTAQTSACPLATHLNNRGAIHAIVSSNSYNTQYGYKQLPKWARWFVAEIDMLYPSSDYSGCLSGKPVTASQALAALDRITARLAEK